MDEYFDIRRLVRECCVDQPEACLQWCQTVGLLPETPACSKCRRDMILSTKRDGTAAGMRWRCHKCSKEVSLAGGTVKLIMSVPIYYYLFKISGDIQGRI